MLRLFASISPVLLLVSCMHQPLQPIAPPAPEPTPLAIPQQPTKAADTGSTATSITSPWRLVTDSPQALAQGTTLHEMRFTRQDADGVDVSVVSFDSRSSTLRVLNQPNPNAGSSAMRGLMNRAGAIAGVNGGYFHPDFSPLGHLIAQEEKIGSLTRTSLVSGMVLVKDQSPSLLWNREYHGDAGVSDLIQCGPRLVDGGEPVSGLNNNKLSARTFVATDGSNHWLIGVARYTTLQGLSEILATPGLILGLRIDRALNLDGGRSTALYARRSDNTELNDPGWSTVRNYLAVVPRH